jgi:hypothetical protein
MNHIDPAANNSSDQPRVIVLDEFAAISKSLEGHLQRERILGKIRNYQSRLLRQARSKKD